MTFNGKPRYDEKHLHPHESPSTMTVPLIILAFLSIFGGLIGLPGLYHMPNLLKGWLDPVFEKSVLVLNTLHPHAEHALTPELIIIAVSVIISVFAIYMALKKYSNMEKFEESTGFGKVLENKYYVDEAYDKIIVNPIEKTSEKFLWNIFDVKIIDGAVNGIARYISSISFDWRRIQTGVIQDYAGVSVAGIVLILLYLLIF